MKLNEIDKNYFKKKIIKKSLIEPTIKYSLNIFVNKTS